MSLDVSAPRSDREIYLAALDIPDERQRLAFLQQSCGGDAEPLRSIQRLLAARLDRETSPVDLARPDANMYLRER